MTARFGSATLALALVFAAAPAARSEDHDASIRVVEELHTALIGVMKDAKALGYTGRYDRLAPVLQSHFDIPFMAEKSVGRYWRGLDDPQRAELTRTFGEFTTANYAGRFDGFSGQSFETLGAEAAMHETVLVRTRINDPGGETTQLDYRLRAEPDGWRIIDVYLNGTVSELALRRSEYSSLIQREGYDSLIKALHERIAELSTSEKAG